MLSKEYVRGLLPVGSIVKLVCKSYDSKGKFGRILGWVWANGVNVNKQMIDENMAVAYHGQSKDDIEQAHLNNRAILQERGKV